LKRAYRDITVGERRGVTLVYLKGAEPVIRERIEARTHRYMPASLLGSQFETLEEPGPDEHPVTVVVHGSIAETVTEILKQLAARSIAASG
jgi:carbohydrate kinase (thermoresistant glucokinase family)